MAAPTLQLLNKSVASAWSTQPRSALKSLGCQPGYCAYGLKVLSEDLRRRRSVGARKGVTCATMGQSPSLTRLVDQVSTADLKAKTLSASEKGEATLQVTYLEGNSWHLFLAGVSILIDPVINGAFDFAVPILYSAEKLHLKSLKLEDIPEPDLVLITQHLDDHCHLKTLRPLAARWPDVTVFAPINARHLLTDLFKKVTFLDHWNETDFQARNGKWLKLMSTSGALVGPPWQHRENGWALRAGASGLHLSRNSGYIVSCKEVQTSVYWEPHCMYDAKKLGHYQADVVLTPVVSQRLPRPLPLYELVAGQQKAVDLCKLLKAKYVVPVDNGDLDAKGPANLIVSTVGTIESFTELMGDSSKGDAQVKVLQPTPGRPIVVQ